MAIHNLALLGFGNVGKALARLLQVKTGELKERYGIEWRITGVASRRLGWLARPEGFEVTDLLAGRLPAPQPFEPEGIHAWLEHAQVGVLFENTSLNAQTGEPAISHLRTALEHGAHAITANKGPVVHAHAELTAVAHAHGRRFFYESAVMDGAPIFSLFREALPAAQLLRFKGILNSTTNFILTEMENGADFDAAVRQAQAIGIAETDPSADVDGWDAAVKVSALASVLMGVPLKPEQIERQGIRGLTGEQVRTARAEGLPYKLVCRAERQGDRVHATIRPEQVPLSDPLSAVSGTSSLVHFETDVLPGLTLTEHNPGPQTTAYGLLADFVNAVR